MKKTKVKWVWVICNWDNKRVPRPWAPRKDIYDKLVVGKRYKNLLIVSKN